MLGEKVMELSNAEYKAGYQQVQLNTTASGIASGTYLYSIETKTLKLLKR